MDTHPESVKLGLCSWRTLPVPAMLQLVALFAGLEPLLDPCLLAPTTRTAVDTACELFARLEPLLGSCTSGAHYLYHR